MKRKIAIFIMLICLISCFAVYFDDYSECISEKIEPTTNIGEMTKSHVYTQKLKFNYDSLESIRIYFATFGRGNGSNLKIRLFENDGETCLQEWDVDCARLEDNAYYTLMMDSAIKVGDGSYYLQIISNANEGNGVTIYSNDSGVYSGYEMDGVASNGMSLCYQLQYSNFINADIYPFLIIFLFVTAIIFGAWYFVSVKVWAIEKIFLLLWCSISMLYMSSNTLFNVPDEDDHFFRAYEISMGYPISSMNESGTAGGRELPINRTKTEVFKSSWQSTVANKGMTIDNHYSFQSFSNMSLYAPISYLPQAIGIFVARHLTNYVALIAYAGRLVNWACITVLLYWSIKILPYGKCFLVLTAFIPMNIHEAVSLAPDGMVIAVSAFMIAYVLYLKYIQEKRLSDLQICLLYVLALLISLYKIVYLPFCLIYLLIPVQHFKNRKRKILHAVIMTILIIGINLIWLKICNKFILKKGVDGTLQILYILKYPLTYYIMLCRTYINNAWWLVQTMLGSTLAWLSVNVVQPFIVIYACLLVKKSNTSLKIVNNDALSKRILFVGIIAIIGLLTSTSLYMQWTPIYNTTIVGLQGRYFLPLLFPLYMAFTMDGCPQFEKENLDFISIYCIILVNVGACMALLFSCL